MERDDIDVKILVDFFKHSRFPDADAIMSIAAGITRDKDINCYDAFEEGLKIMKKTERHNLRELKLLKRYKINPLLATNNKIKINDDFVPVDRLLLFQRICVSKTTDTELKNYMNYELAPYPLALFENGELRNTKLFREISINFKGVEKVHYVIDEGMLLH
ncbi:hypothetical protein ILUMI_08449, partial [Ignelater luminosus]